MPAYRSAYINTPYPLPEAQEHLSAAIGRLLGKLPAAWFRDACRLSEMTQANRLETTAYVVPMLLSQVEERLRRVLLPDDFVPLAESEIRPQELDAVAAVCELSEETLRRWHRTLERLDRAREEQPSMVRLDGLLADCEHVFSALVNGLANHYVEVLRKIDRLSPRPTPESLRRLLQNIPDNVIVHDRLLAKIPHEGRYLAGLHAAGFFRSPPPPDRDEQGVIKFCPRWKAAEFLADVASDPALQETVWAILQDLPPTENDRVHADLATAAMKLPVALAAQWARQEVLWLGMRSTRKHIYDEAAASLGNMAENLVHRGEISAALALFRALLQLPSRGTFAGISPTHSTTSPFDEHAYEEIVRERVPALLKIENAVAASATLDMLASVLESVEEWHAEEGKENRDFLSFERKEIDPNRKTEDRMWPQHWDLLIDHTVAAAELLAKYEPIGSLVARIEQRKGLIFQRLALHLLRRFPEGAEGLIRGRIVDLATYQRRILDPEYAHLLGEQFGRLTRAQQQTVLGWISKGPPDDLRAEIHSFGGGAAQVEQYVRSWTYRHLQELEPSLSLLPETWQERYVRLKHEFSEPPQQMSMPSRSADDMLKLDLPTLVHSLSSKDLSAAQNPTELPALREAVAREPARFAEKSGGFLALDVQYQGALLDGLWESLREGKKVPLSKVLLLIKDLLVKPLPRIQSSWHSEPLPWGGIHLSVARLIEWAQHGQDEPHVSIADMPEVFQILDMLLSLPPDPRRDRAPAGYQSDPNQISTDLLNTPRGLALTALLRATSWVKRDLKQHGKESTTLRDIPQASRVLMRVLRDNDPLMHGGIGKSFWNLAWIDPTWVRENLRRIFPISSDQKELFRAAWVMYLVYGGYYPNEEWFPELRFAYEHAIDQIEDAADGEAKTEEKDRPASQLGSQLIHLYVNELLDIRDGDLLVRYFDRATDFNCAESINTLVREVRRSAKSASKTSESREEPPVAAQALPRALEFWRWRKSKLLANPNAHRKEAAAFVLLFTSEVLASPDSLENLELLLSMAESHRWQHEVLERLAALCPQYPAACMRCLTTFLNRGGYPDKTPTFAILQVVLERGEPEAKRSAREWANRLVASGLSDFETLIMPRSRPEANLPTVAPGELPKTQISRIVVEGFKSLHSMDLELGTFNVLIGANGSGKTNVLEAIGVLGAAAFKEVVPETLMERNIRPARALLYKSSFQAHDLRRVITIAAHGSDGVLYQVGFDPGDEGGTRWRIFSERLEADKRKLLRRNARACLIYGTDGKFQRIAEPINTQTYAGTAVSLNPDAKSVRAALDALQGFCVFSPSTQVLRGLSEDRGRAPLGLGGGGLPSAIRDLLSIKDQRLGSFDLDDVLELINWAETLSVIPSSEAMLSPAIHPGQLVVQFRDRFMKRGRNFLTAYDASEGALYVLFYLALASHPAAPRFCAVDNFDQCLHPRLASRLTRLLSTHLVNEGSRQWLLTTHNPLVLDGLDLSNERIRLFAVDRDDNGTTQVRRIQVNPELITDISKGYSLSRLWVMGRLGGVPEL